MKPARFCIALFICIFSYLPVAQAKDVKIAVLIKGMSNPYWKALEEGARDAAKAPRISLTLQGVQTDQESEQQLNMCQTILLQKPDVLITAPVNGVNLIPCLQQAQKNGVTLVDVDGGFTKEQAKEHRLKIKFSVASNNYNLGKKAAQYLKGQKGKVLVLEGLAGSTPGILRLEGFQKNLPKGLKIVASQPGDWDRLKAANITNDVLTKYSDLKVIFAANDLMALGAAEALQAKNIPGVTVIGIDGIGDAVKAIKEGRLTASVAQLPYLMGKEAVEKAVKAVNDNKRYGYKQYVPILLLDKNTLEGNKDPDLQYLR